MSAWWSLLQKEWRLTRAAVLTSLAALVGAGFLDLYLFFRNERLALFLAVITFFAHVVYLPVYVGASLSHEQKNTAHLWLSLPRCGWTLLAAKLVSGLFSLLLSLALCLLFILGLLALSRDPIPLPRPLIWQYSGWAALGVILASLYITSWVMLIQVSDYTVKSWPKGVRHLLSLLLVIVMAWGIPRFSRTPLYDTLIRWGEFRLSLSLPNREPLPIPLHAGELLFFALLALLLFALAGWLLDRKAEV